MAETEAGAPAAAVGRPASAEVRGLAPVRDSAPVRAQAQARVPAPGTAQAPVDTAVWVHPHDRS